MMVVSDKGKEERVKSKQRQKTQLMWILQCKLDRRIFGGAK